MPASPSRIRFSQRTGRGVLPALLAARRAAAGGRGDAAALFAGVPAAANALPAATIATNRSFTFGLLIATIPIRPER
jgi:hypothetical protein